MKKVVLVLFLIFLFSSSVSAEEGLRSLFLNNKAVICGINIRNFNSKDINHNGIIDNGEESGNFVNALERLDEVKDLHINTLHVLPITPVGKLKALGTAGSLYAISDFTSINPQIVDKTSDLTPQEQFKNFIDECHKRGIYVVIDLPSCGSYDLFLSHPEYFLKDKKQLSIVPTDWTDVRLFNTGNNDRLNDDLLNAHKAFIDMITEAGADGVRADVATIKPSKFWEELISYSRKMNPEFMFLAEASDSWREPPSKYAEFTPYDELLRAGFDGYYGSFFNFKDWKSSEEFIEHIKFNKKLTASYSEPKSVILSFTTHDELSPIVLRGEKLSVMISWLEATLPFNPYIIDGFPYGDDYVYPWANNKAAYTETDDDYYFVHRGKLDIFNYSRKPEGNNQTVSMNFKKATQFREENADLISKGTFVPLKTDNDSVFAYARCYKGETIIVLGNLDYKKNVRRVIIKYNGIKKKSVVQSVRGLQNYKIKNNRIITDFSPYEIKVLRVTDLSL